MPGIITDRPQVTIVCGKKGSGKSCLCVKLLKTHFKYVYKKIIIISPTFRAQYAKLWCQISHEGVIVYEALTQQVITKIFDEMMENDEETLLLLDDCGEELKHCEPRLVNMLVSNSRHRNLSMIVLCQKITQMPTILRCNADSYIMYSSSSYLERECLYKEVSTVEKKEFIKIFNKATEKEYSFLVCVMSRTGQLQFYHSDFETRIK